GITIASTPEADAATAGNAAATPAEDATAPGAATAETTPATTQVAKTDARSLFEQAKQQSADGAVAKDAVASVRVISGGDLNLIGAQTIANNVSLQAAGNLNMRDLHEVSSDFKASTEHGFLAAQSTTETFGNATSKGNAVNASDLTINVGGDWNVTGGAVNATTSAVKVAGDTTIAAGKDASFYEKVQTTIQLVAGASAGANGHEVSSEASRFDTQKSPTARTDSDHSDQDVNEDAGAASGANKNRGDTVGTRYRYGIEIVKTTDTQQSTTHKNAQLNLGSGTLNVGGTFDLGGADINANHQLTAGQRAAMSSDELAKATEAMPTLAISASEIKSTKFEDIHKQSFSRDETFIGVSHETHSSVLNVANNIQKTADKAADGMKIDPALTTMAEAGNVTQLLFGDTVGASLSIGVKHTKERNESEQKSENINQIGGNISLTTTKGDIDLNGVNIQGGKVALDSAGAINQRAAKTSGSAKASIDIYNAGLTVAGSAGPMGSGVGASVGADGSHDRTEESSTSYTNGLISGANVTIKAKGDHLMEGANIDAGHLDYAIGGTQTITSKQDNYNMEHERGSWSVGAGVAISTLGIVPTGSASASGGKDYDKSDLTAVQSGIQAGSMNLHVGGNQNLTGAHIINTSGQGSYRVDGTLTVADLADSRDKDGGYGGGGGGISKSGVPSVVVEAGRVDQVKYEATQHSTIQIGTGKPAEGAPQSEGGISVGGGIVGTLNQDAGKMTEVTRDDKVAGTDIKIELALPAMKKKKNKTAAEVDIPTATHVTNDVDIDIPSARRVTNDVTIDTPTARHVPNDVTIDTPTARHVPNDVTIDTPTANRVTNDVTIETATAKQVNDDVTVKGPGNAAGAVDTVDGSKILKDSNARHMTAATTGTELKNALAKLNSPNKADQASLKTNPVEVNVRGADGKVKTYTVNDATSLKALHGTQVVTGEAAEHVNRGSGLGQSSTLYIKVIPQPGGGFTTSFTPTPPKPL
ncbi:MAG: hemagglutinin repeat-containing protein, partial [Pseudomonas sp.]